MKKLMLALFAVIAISSTTILIAATSNGMINGSGTALPEAPFLMFPFADALMYPNPTIVNDFELPIWIAAELAAPQGADDNQPLTKEEITLLGKLARQIAKQTVVLDATRNLVPIRDTDCIYCIFLRGVGLGLILGGGVVWLM